MVTLMPEACLLNIFNDTNLDTGLPFDNPVLFLCLSLWSCIISFLSVRDVNIFARNCTALK